MKHPKFLPKMHASRKISPKFKEGVLITKTKKQSQTVRKSLEMSKEDTEESTQVP